MHGCKTTVHRNIKRPKSCSSNRADRAGPKSATNDLPWPPAEVKLLVKDPVRWVGPAQRRR